MQNRNKRYIKFPLCLTQVRPLLAINRMKMMEKDQVKHKLTHLLCSKEKGSLTREIKVSPVLLKASPSIFQNCPQSKN